MCGWEGNLHLPREGCENVNTAARPPSRQRNWIAPRFDGLFVYLCIIICSAWLLSICFSSPLVIPTPVAAAGQCCSWERKCSTTTLPGWGEPAGERRSSWSHLWNSTADAQKVFHTDRGSGAQDWSVFPQGMARGRHGLGLCLQPALDKPLLLHVLLIPAGSHAAVVQ